MRIPGFTAEASCTGARRRYQSETSFDNATKLNQVHMQLPNSQNTAGGACYGHTSGTIVAGYYDALGRCCTGPDYKGFPFCIDCDADKCYDRKASIAWNLSNFINLQRAGFARF